MKIVEGSTNNLPTTVHVEQDGDHFFVLPHAREEVEGYVPALAVIVVDCETYRDDELTAAQHVVRAHLASLGVDASYDY